MNGQTLFTAALLDAGRPVPTGLLGPTGAAAGTRFDVYRNNVLASLIEALGTGFPVIRALVGDAFFAAMAGEFVRQHPPRSPRLFLYGDALPRFLEGFAPVAHLPYLPDVARLELALRESYHAADAEPIAAATLAALPADLLPHVRLRLAPSVRLLRSQWPVAAIWQAHHGGPKPCAGAQDVLVARPGFDPVVHALPVGGHDLIAAVLAGETLGAALEAAPRDLDASDISILLQLLLETRAICAIEVEAHT